MSASALFITGTDTGVGKTVLTALLLSHIRQTDREVIAIKPFCSGPRDDIDLLCKLQDGQLSQDQINPYYFPEPLAPLVSAPPRGGRPSLSQVMGFLHGFARSHPERKRPYAYSSPKNSDNKRRGRTVLIEGIGGVLVPLEKGFCVLDLIVGLDCPAIVVGRNALGTLNHTLLTTRVMQHAGIKRLKVVLMGVAVDDLSVKSNEEVLSELLAPIPVVSIPFLGRKAHKIGGIRIAAKNLKKSLALLAK